MFDYKRGLEELLKSALQHEYAPKCPAITSILWASLTRLQQLSNPPYGVSRDAWEESLDSIEESLLEQLGTSPVDAKFPYEHLEYLVWICESLDKLLAEYIASQADLAAAAGDASLERRLRRAAQILGTPPPAPPSRNGG